MARVPGQSRTSHLRRRPFRAALTATLFLVGLAAGCGYSGGEAIFMSGLFKRPTVEAEFQLTDEPVAVLVDDLRDCCFWPEAKHVLADEIAAQLVEHGAAKRVIPPIKVNRLRQSTTDFDDLAITSVGRRLEAEQIVSVDVRSFYVELSPEEARGAASMSVAVKVIDTQASAGRGRVRLWPAIHSGHPLNAELDAATVTRLASREAVVRALTHSLAVEIAKLFYDRPMEDFE